ncbi:ABC transporter substrate-binding protein [Caenispirillum bisanense]|uniref:MlaC/ttg2D family ABC transporter substrate-binding protein n=1 Tax=Caenispirillum bisanense TaxID=414052 RepID=UPI0031D588B5
MIRRFLAPLFVAATLTVAPVAAHAEIAPDQAKQFISSIADRGINNILAADVPVEERTRRFRDMFIETFDVDTTARFVLARHWRAATPEEQQEFKQLFRDYNVLIWAQRFDEYNGQRLDVTGTQPDGDAGIFVESRVVAPQGGQPVNIIWRLRDRGGQPQVIDIVVEGVSMALTYRSEYDSVVSRSGVSGLNQLLRQKVQELGGR